MNRIILPGRVAQSVRYLTLRSEGLGRYPVWPHTFVSPSADSRGAVVSYWRKDVHEVLVNRLGGLGLPRKSVVRLTDRPYMTLDVYRGRKTITQQQQRIILKGGFTLRHMLHETSGIFVFANRFNSADETCCMKKVVLCIKQRVSPCRRT